MSLRELEDRIQNLENIEAIRQLKAKYADICDDHYNPDEIAKLFTNDALWGRAGEDKSIIKGREAIRENYREIQKRYIFGVHYFTQPQIRILTNDEAEGKWYFLCAVSLSDGTPLWIAGAEHEKYKKVNGQWLISYLKAENFFRAPYKEGWIPNLAPKPARP